MSYTVKILSRYMTVTIYIALHGLILFTKSHMDCQANVHNRAGSDDTDNATNPRTAKPLLMNINSVHKPSLSHCPEKNHLVTFYDTLLCQFNIIQQNRLAK